MLSQQFLKATRMNQLPLRSIENLELDLTQVKKMGTQCAFPKHTVDTQNALKPLLPIPTYAPTAKQAGCHHKRTGTPE